MKTSRAFHYLLALLVPALMAGLIHFTWPLFEQIPIGLFLLAIVFCGWYGGTGPGLLSAAVSIPLADYFFIYPYSSPPQHRNDLVKLLVLAIIGVCTSLLSALTHRERRQAAVSLELANAARFALASDVSERKQAEAALREAEQKYRNIFANALEGIFQTSPEGRFLVANSALAGMFGFDSTEELISERADISKQHYVDPKRRDEFKRLMEAEGTVYQFEYEAYRRDGSRIWVSDTVRAVRNGSGKVVCYEGIAKDITERKRAERRSEAFATLARKLSGVSEPLGAAQTIADAAQNLFGWESFALKLYDADQDLIHPLLYIDTVHDQLANVTPVTAGTKPAPRSRLVINEGAQLTLREAPYEFGEDSVPFGDTHRPSASVMTVPIRHSAEVVGILSIQSYRPHAYDHQALSDLQALADYCGAALHRIWAEEALRAQKEILRKIFDHIPIMVTFIDNTGHLSLANREWERTRGITLEQVREQKLDPVVESYPNPDDQQKVRDFISAATGEWADFKTTLNDGRVLDTCWAVVKLSDGTRITIGQDITERKKAEDALRESEERYRALFENAKDATYVHDLNGRYISVNRAAEKLTGHTRDEILGRKFSDFIPAEEVAVVSEHMCNKLTDEGETIYETEVIASDGRHIPVKVSSHLIYENGVATSVQGTARDISDRRRAEARLREYEKVVEGLEEMIVVVDQDFRYLLANRAYLKYRSKNREQVLGHLVPEVAGKDLFVGVIKEKLEQAFQGQVVNYELKTQYPELGERAVLVSYFPIDGPTGIDRVACVIQDITEGKRAEVALRQSEERFSKAFHSSPASLSIALLEDGSLLEVNDAFLRMTGYSREDVIGRSTLEIGLWANPDYRLTMTDKLRDGAVADLDFKFRKKSGELRDGLLSVELIELGGEPCLLGIALDITERIRADAELQSYPRLLLEAQERERQSIARELHDQIGQVLTAIRINLQTVWDTCETSESRALIDEGVAIVDEALEQVRDLSFELRPSVLDDLGLAAALRWYSDRFARRTGINAATAIDLPESPRLRLELETACFRIVQEALTNVVRHARARKVSITLRSVKTEVVLSIKDDGVGFDALTKDAPQFTTHLGLRGIKERALALGGRLEIKSSPSRGTEIKAHFPRQTSKD